MDNYILAAFASLVMGFYISEYSGTRQQEPIEVVVQRSTQEYSEEKPKEIIINGLTFKVPKISFTIPENDTALHRKQIECLADNIFHESKGEPDHGKLAVAFVTMNRAMNKHFPDTICSVVKQRTRKVCQFSWYCDSKKFQQSKNSLLTKRRNELYNEIYQLAKQVYYQYGLLEDPTDGALFFHADYVNPYWNKSMTETAKIGRHIFYSQLSLMR